MRRALHLFLVLVLLPAAAAAGARAERAEDTGALFRLYREGRIALLGPRLAAALAARPGDVDLRLLEGFVALRRGAAERARRAFAAVLERAPDYDDARIGLARALLLLGDPEAAHVALAPVAWRLEEDPAVLALFVHVDLARGRRELAEAKLWRFREVHAGDPAMLEEAARIAHGTGLAPHPAVPAAEGSWRAFAYARREWADGGGTRGEGHLALLRTLPDGSSLSLATDWRRRHSREELGVSLSQTTPVAGGMLESALALAPQGRTLPRVATSFSFTAAAFAARGVGFVPGVHFSFRHYRDGTAVIGGPGLRIAAGRVELALRGDLARDSGGRTDLGLAARIGLRIRNGLRVHVAAGLLRDDEGRAVHERTLSFGWSWERGDGTRLFCDVGLTRRRSTAFASGCGVAVRTGG